MKKKWWGYYEVDDPDTIYLLENTPITDKLAGSLFAELPRRIRSKGIVPFVVGIGHLSKERMDSITGSEGGIIP